MCALVAQINYMFLFMGLVVCNGDGIKPCLKLD
jgi:hypothetical protein